PSSREIFLTWLLAFRINIFPTSVDPVKEIFRTRGSSSQAFPISSGFPVTTLKTPAGMPASSAASASFKAVSGVSSAGLTTTVQPQARAGAAFRTIIDAGKFQGVINAATPTGCFKTRILLLGAELGT